MMQQQHNIILLLLRELSEAVLASSKMYRYILSQLYTTSSLQGASESLKPIK